MFLESNGSPKVSCLAAVEMDFSLGTKTHIHFLPTWFADTATIPWQVAAWNCQRDESRQTTLLYWVLRPIARIYVVP